MSGLSLDARRLAGIANWMQRYIDEDKYTGSSISIAQHGRVAYRACIGKRSLARDEPYTPDTIVRIFSMTKPITAVALMRFIERGVLHLDARIDQFLPEFANCYALRTGARNIDEVEAVPAPTVHQLLTHTAGMTYSFNETLLAKAYAEQNIDFMPNAGGLAQATQRLAKLPLAFVPGQCWEYSVSMDVIGRLLEVLSGASLREVMQQEVLQPLGMVDTDFYVPHAKVVRFADCYLRTATAPLSLLDDARQGWFTEGAVDTWSGGGGLVSTLDDCLRFCECLRQGGRIDASGEYLLSPQTVDLMCSNHLCGDIASMGPLSWAEMPMTGVGFGIGGSVVLSPAQMRVPGSVGDYSWGGMASTYFWVDRKLGLSVVFFTQLVPSSSFPARAELKALVHGALRF